MVFHAEDLALAVRQSDAEREPLRRVLDHFTNGARMPFEVAELCEEILTIREARRSLVS